ncbi:MAG: SAM-dependent methyltransferase TehB [Pseudomonadota bacterium]
MLNIDNDLIPYKQITIDSQGKLQFFLEKHSTKEGTWGLLRLETGEIEFVILDGEGRELSKHRIDKNNPQMSIPPASWHKIKLVSEKFTGTLEFYCKPHRYFNKKYSLGNVQSDLYYAYNTYFSKKNELNILDIGCGSGRNLLYLALSGHQLTGIDINQSSIQQVEEIIKKENMSNIKLITHDLCQPLTLQKEAFDVVISIVSLQFLGTKCIPSLLTELQSTTVSKGLHLILHPIKAELYSLPSSFTYLPESKTLYHFYQDKGWSVLEYKEFVGHTHQRDDSGKPIRGLFALLLAQKI